MTTGLCELQSFLVNLEIITKYERSACAAPDHCIAPPPRAFAVVLSRSIANVPSKAYVWMLRSRASGGSRNIIRPKCGGEGGYRVK